MIKAKKTLLLLVILFIALITIFTTIRFRTVKHFTQIYTYPEWKLNDNNGFRLAFLEFMNRKSFLPFYLDLYIIDSTGKKLKLDTGKQKAKLYNKVFNIKGLKAGIANLKGIVKFDDNVVDNFNIAIKIIDKYGKTQIKLAPRVIIETNSDFKKEDKIITYPRFNKLTNGEYNKNNEDDIMIQLFGSPIDLVFSEKNTIFLLFTLPDYTPINLKVNLDIRDFFSKNKELTLNTDKNGLISFNENIFRSGGYILLKSELFHKKRKLVFSLSEKKTAILTNKDIYSKNETIKLNIKTYKKIDYLYFNVIIGNSWIKNQKIAINKNGNEIEFIPPKNYTGFIEFNVYKGYSYLKDSSYKKVFVGNKNMLKKELLTLKNDFINKVINKSTDNSNFYRLIMSQLEKNKLGINKVFDSYKSQQEKLDKDREKYQAITWLLLLLVAITIILIIFFTSYSSIKNSQKDIEYQFRQKGGIIYLFIFISILIAFMALILWILKIV